jgi:sortase A
VAEYPFTSAAHARDRRRRPRRSRAGRWLAILLILAGALVLIDGAVTLLWQEPISALIAKLHQDRLSGQLRRVDEATPSATEEHALAGIADERRRVAYLAARFQLSARDGSAVGRIDIPSIGASYVMVAGTGTSELESGPGIYSDASFPGTGFPGTGRTTAIAGHRTTYLAPFRHIDSLVPGDTIHVDMPYADFTYTVLGHRVVSPDDVAAAIADVGYNRVVLSACTPLFSAAKRLLVYARLTRTVPRGAARLLTEGELARPIVSPLHSSGAAARPLPPVLESLGPYYVAPSS